MSERTDPTPAERVTLLAGLRIAEVGPSVAVAMAGKLLCDAGAEVTHFGPRCSSESPHLSDPAPYASYTDTHKSFAATDGDLIHALGSFDVAVIDDAALTTARTTVADIVDAHPHLVLTTITPYGTVGPRSRWRATDFTLQARGGLSFGVGEGDGPPLPLPGHQAEMQGGIAGAIGSLIASISQRTSGVGQHVDISIDDVLSTFFTGYYLPRYIYGGGVPGRRAGRTGSNSPYPNTMMRCADGYVALIAPQVEQWIRFVALMGDPPWTKLARYRNRRAMQWEYKAEVDGLVAPWFSDKIKAELLALFVKHRVPFAPILDGADLLGLEHLGAVSAIRQVDVDAATIAVPAPPYIVASNPLEPDRDGTANRLPPRPRGDVSPAGVAAALGGLRILDLGTAWAGGMAGRILADFGADVVKVESSRHLDGSRKGRPIGVADGDGDEGQWPEMQPGFHVISRNKRSIGLDLRSEAAISVIVDLAAECDAVIHNFPPGVMDRLGLTDDHLRTKNAELLIVGQCVAGYRGPLSGYIGYNSTVGGLSGLFGLIGFEDEEPIGNAEGLFSDIVSALTTVYVTLAGLHGRSGVSVEVSQWQATMALLPELLIGASTRQCLQPVGRRHWGVAPNGVYPCHGDDEWIAISVNSAADWAALVEVIGRSDLAADHSLQSVAGRRAAARDIDDSIVAWTSTRPAASAVEQVQASGVAADAVCSIEHLFVDEHLREREAWVDTEHPMIGWEPLPGPGLRLTGTPGSIRTTAPFVGQHTIEILRDVVGYDDRRLEQLRRAGVIEQAETLGSVR